MQTYFETIEDSHGINLCSIWYTVNQKQVLIENGVDSFLISDPSKFIISLKPEEYQKYFKDLKQFFHQIDFYPAGYGKGQKTDVYQVTLNLGYGNNPPEVKVLSFGGSYGKLLIDNIEVDLSHSGGTNGFGWRDSTRGWYILGNNRIKALEHLISKMRK